MLHNKDIFEDTSKIRKLIGRITEIYIIAIVIIFGAISAGFFYMGQRGTRRAEVKR